MDRDIYENAIAFKKKYPLTIAWRLKKHASVIQKNINDDEVVLYTFAGQYVQLWEKNQGKPAWYQVFSSAVFVLTNKRLIVGRKRFFGRYFFSAITPDMLNDFEINGGIIWGSVEIDTIKEHFFIIDIDKKALPEIEDAISKYLINEKMKYLKRNTDNSINNN